MGNNNNNSHSKLVPQGALKLTAKQEAFAQAIFAGKSQADAYRQSYDASGMTPKQVYEEASKLVRHPKVAQRIAELQSVTRHETQVDANDIAEELKRIGFASLEGIGEWSKDGFILKDSSDIPPEVAAAVSEIQEIRHRDGTVGMRLKLYDKLAALDKLAKLCGLYREDKQERDNRPINITRVVIQFPDGRTETQEIKPRGPVVEGESRTLPEDETGSHA